MTTKVYGFFYNSCIYESAEGLVSLHTTEEQAVRAMEKDKIEHYKKWLELEDHFKECLGEDYDESRYDNPYETWCVREVEVLNEVA